MNYANLNFEIGLPSDGYIDIINLNMTSPTDISLSRSNT